MIEGKEVFGWDIVEKCINDPEMQDDPLMRLTPDFPEPQPGFKWYWVQDISFLSGHGGWLEVNVAEKKQGRYKMMLRS